MIYISENPSSSLSFSRYQISWLDVPSNQRDGGIVPAEIISFLEYFADTRPFQPADLVSTLGKSDVMPRNDNNNSPCWAPRRGGEREKERGRGIHSRSRDIQCPRGIRTERGGCLRIIEKP